MVSTTHSSWQALPSSVSEIRVERANADINDMSVAWLSYINTQDWSLGLCLMQNQNSAEVLVIRQRKMSIHMQALITIQRKMSIHQKLLFTFCHFQRKISMDLKSRSPQHQVASSICTLISPENNAGLS